MSAWYLGVAALAAVSVFASTSRGQSVTVTPLPPIPIPKSLGPEGGVTSQFSMQFSLPWGLGDISIQAEDSKDLSITVAGTTLNFLPVTITIPVPPDPTGDFDVPWRQIVGYQELAGGPITGLPAEAAVLHARLRLLGTVLPMTIIPISNLDTQAPTGAPGQYGPASIAWNFDQFVAPPDRLGNYFLLSCDIPGTLIVPAPGAGGLAIVTAALACRRRRPGAVRPG